MNGPIFWVDFFVAILTPVTIAILVFVILADDDNIWRWSRDE